MGLTSSNPVQPPWELERTKLMAHFCSRALAVLAHLLACSLLV